MIELLDYLREHFWSLFLAAFVVWIFIGDGIKAAFHTLLSAVTGRANKRRLTRREERALRREVTDLRRDNDNLRQTVFVAADILRDVAASDRVFPQLPPDTLIRIEAFLDKHLQRPELPADEPKKRDE